MRGIVDMHGLDDVSLCHRVQEIQIQCAPMRGNAEERGGSLGTQNDICIAQSLVHRHGRYVRGCPTSARASKTSWNLHGRVEDFAHGALDSSWVLMDALPGGGHSCRQV